MRATYSWSFERAPGSWHDVGAVSGISGSSREARRTMAQATMQPAGFRMAGSSPGELLKSSETVHFYQDDGFKLEGDLLVKPGPTPKLAIIFYNVWGGARHPRPHPPPLTPPLSP